MAASKTWLATSPLTLDAAVDLMTKIQAAVHLTDMKVIDLGSFGCVLCIKKNAVPKKTFLLMRKFINRNSLKLSEAENYYLVSASEICPFEENAVAP